VLPISVAIAVRKSGEDQIIIIGIRRLFELSRKEPMDQPKVAA